MACITTNHSHLDQTTSLIGPLACTAWCDGLEKCTNATYDNSGCTLFSKAASTGDAYDEATLHKFDSAYKYYMTDKISGRLDHHQIDYTQVFPYYWEKVIPDSDLPGAVHSDHGGAAWRSDQTDQNVFGSSSCMRHVHTRGGPEWRLAGLRGIKPTPADDRLVLSGTFSCEDSPFDMRWRCRPLYFNYAPGMKHPGFDLIQPMCYTKSKDPSLVTFESNQPLTNQIHTAGIQSATLRRASMVCSCITTQNLK